MLQHWTTWLLTIIPLSTSQFIIHLVNGVISQLLSRSLIVFHYTRKIYSIFIKQCNDSHTGAVSIME